MIETFPPETAPGFAKFASSFKNDSRCEDIFFVVGDDEDEVWAATTMFHAENECIDFDVCFSVEGDKWVGVVTRDKD